MEAGEFKGRIGRYHWESEAWWPPEPAPPAGAPNVLLVVLDDVGFAQLGCFGSDIDTPHLDALAARGLRYSNFHTTALCSPTRACVLTGRNHHVCGLGRVIDLATGFPGYDARLSSAIPMLPAMLTPHGYAAYAVGKWHLTPEDETHLGARRDRWPLGRGFERFYGFFPGETHQFVPALVHDNHLAQASASYEDGYHLTTDLVDRAIEGIEDLRNASASKPWFTYLATGACHSPHQSPAGWVERFRGRFDAGWDEWREATLDRQKAMGVLPAHTELSPRPDWVPAWSSLSPLERQVYARYMEAFAAYLSHTDHELGRLFARLDALGELDDTLVLVLSDNGASSEGGPTGSLNDARMWNALPSTVEEAADRIDEIGGPRIHNNYPWGWTVAGNTPFKRWKRETHEGGVCDPLIVAWPGGVPASAHGEVRRQYVHAVDIVPTVLAAIGVEAPEVPTDGVSFAPTFADAAAPEQHTVQYYEMLGCRALYMDKWKAVAFHPIQVDGPPGLDQVSWELYDMEADPAECHDLSGQEPERLAHMVERWWEEAERNQVLPLDNRPFSELVFSRPGLADDGRTRYTYWPGRAPVPESVAVNVRGRPHVVTAHVTVGTRDGDGPIEGVLAQQGSVLGGWSFHLLGDGRLVYVHNLAGWRLYRVEAPVGDRLAPGDHTLAMRFDPPAVTLLVDGAVVGSGEVKRAVWSRFSITGAGLTAGWAPDYSPAADDYRGPFPFTGGVLHRVEVDVSGVPDIDPAVEADTAIASQ